MMDCPVKFARNAYQNYIWHSNLKNYVKNLMFDYDPILKRINYPFVQKKKSFKNDCSNNICPYDLQDEEEEHQPADTEEDHVVAHPQAATHNSYVYVECPPPSSFQDIRQFDLQPLSVNHPQQQQLTYSSTIKNHSYTAVQNIHHIPTAVQFQAYNLPVQLTTNNQLSNGNKSLVFNRNIYNNLKYFSNFGW